MANSIASRTLTLRLPSELYERTADLARRRNKSMNALLQDGVETLLREEEIRALSDGFDLLAKHPEECDVEWAIHAQAEVMLRDET